MIRPSLLRGLHHAGVSVVSVLLLVGVTGNQAFAQDGLLDLHFGRPDAGGAAALWDRWRIRPVLR